MKNILHRRAKGSRIVVTSWKAEAAKIMGSDYEYPLGELRSDDCWLIFERITLSRKSYNEELVKIGQKIVKKCEGLLPLAVKTVASMLRDKNSKESWE